MATLSDIAANNALREQALARAHALRRQALRELWNRLDDAWRRIATGARGPARAG